MVGVLSAFLASRCQRGRECRDLRVCESCVVLGAFALSFEPRLLCLVCACETVRLSYPSYGVRHMHSIYLSELVIYCATFVICSA